MSANSSAGIRATGSPNGSTYSIHHRLGADVDSDNSIECFDNGAGQGSDIVAFDVFLEHLDVLQPSQQFVTAIENETVLSPGISQLVVATQNEAPFDLFPGGQLAPVTGTPLTDACYTIGLDDPLDWSPAPLVVDAYLELRQSGGAVVAGGNVTSFFSAPWDGTFRAVAPADAGQGIVETELTMTVITTDERACCNAAGSCASDQEAAACAAGGGVFHPHATCGARTPYLPLAACQPPGCGFSNIDVLDAFIIPASQHAPDQGWAAATADDFMLPSSTSGACEVAQISAYVAYYNIIPNHTPDPALDFQGVSVTVYADDDGAPAGRPLDDGSHVATTPGGILFSETLTSFGTTPGLTPCMNANDGVAGPAQFRITLLLAPGQLILPNGQKLWIEFQPVVNRNGIGQTALMLAQKSYGDYAQQMVPIIGWHTWRNIAGNDGACDGFPQGTRRDVAFEIVAHPAACNNPGATDCNSNGVADYCDIGSGPWMFWASDGTVDSVRRANLDGSGVIDIATAANGLSSPKGVAVDRRNKRVYWSDLGTLKIQSANFDGSAIQDVRTGVTVVDDLVIAEDIGKLYWSGPGNIQRSNLDGTSSEIVISGLSNPAAVEIDHSADKLYWTDLSTRTIERANLDGTGREIVLDLTTCGACGPSANAFALAIDANAGKMYWTNDLANTIQRANLDATGIETLVTGLNSPRGLTLDLAAGKFYWTDQGLDHIKRANLDGTNVETLVASNDSPIGIDLYVPSADCDGNGIPDECDADCNENGAPDSCDIADGTSGDCQPDGTPDECQLDNDAGDFEYALDDGTGETSVGASGGSFAWMNHFIAVEGGKSIATVEIAYGQVANGTPLTVYVWSDPNQDGDPTDAQVLSSVPTVVANANLNVFNSIDIPDAECGPAGTHFFVGAVIQLVALEYPAAIDITASQGRSWVALDSGSPIDPNDLGSAAAPPRLIDSYNFPGNWLIRAEGTRAANDCNGNSIPDACDIASGAGDCDLDGVPDTCQPDCDSNGVPNTCAVSEYALTERFDAYAEGSSMHGQGGWKGWDNDPAVGGEVTAGQKRSLPHALDISAAADLVHEFSGITSGRWTVTAWQYIPAWYSGGSVFILLNTYNDDGSRNWSTLLTFDYAAGQIVSYPEGAIGSYITGAWIPLQVEIDLDADTQTIFYDGVELLTKSWTEGASGGGAVNLGALDLFANGASSVYYDDVSLSRGVNDCNVNGIPDECEADCNNNGTPDDCDLAAGASEDCNTNGILDDCDLAGGTSEDCNTNGIPDQCEVSGADCNTNGVLDACELAGNDCNANGVLDECDLSREPRMYWTELGNDRIGRAGLDGTNVEDITPPGVEGPHDVALDLVANKVYWTELFGNRIERANPDGSNAEVLLSVGSPDGIGVDPIGRKMYWTEGSGPFSALRRANLDGTGIELLVSDTSDSLTNFGDVALDVSAGKVYWAGGTYLSPRILRANLDGTGLETILSPGAVRAIALDTVSAKLYWSDPRGGYLRIWRANLDGSNIETAVSTAPGDPTGIDLDLAARKIYWIDDNARSIKRANLDGSGVETVPTPGAAPATNLVLAVRSRDCNTNAIPDECELAGNDCNTNGVPDGCDIASGTSADANANGTPDECDPDIQDCNLNGIPDDIDLAGPAKVYWTNQNADRIQRANPDGTGVEDLVVTGLQTPDSIAVDPLGGKMYWSDRGTFKLQRANLDGSGVEDLLIPGLSAPFGVALHVSAGKLYFTDDTTLKIQRANLDGSGVEDLVTTGLTSPRALALDLGAEKMYWTDDVGNRIQRANLDGTSVEALITTGLTVPRGIALDLAGQKMYWAEQSGVIRRADLNGGNVETVVAGLDNPVGVAIDLAEGKLYWADSGISDKIQRSDLDGGNIENVYFPGTNINPRGVALTVMAADCDANNVPDECDPDTDGDGLPNGCDACAGGASTGDSDGDGDVDLSDHESFVPCLAGPGGVMGPGCECFDFDADTDIDLTDFADFQALFSS